MDPQAVIEVFRRNLTEHYFDLKGRVGRREFWTFVLASFLVLLAAAIVDGILHTGLLGPVIGLALLLPLTGLGARRLQDIGRDGQLVWLWTLACVVTQVLALLTFMSGPYGALYFLYTMGWLIGLINLAALVISVVLIYFWAQPGTAGPNQFGPDPKGAATP